MALLINFAAEIRKQGIDYDTQPQQSERRFATTTTRGWK